MSVIHNVLTKLDARGAERPAALGAIPASTNPQPDGTWRRIVVMAAVGIAAVGFVALADWPNWLRSASAARPAAMEPTPAAEGPAAPVVVVAVPAVVAPNPAPVAVAPVSPAVAPAAPPRTVAPQRVALATVPSPRHVVAATAPAETDSTTAQIDKRSVAFSPSQRALLLLRQAHESAQTGQPRAALTLAREALTLDPTLAAARLLAAVLEHETGTSERAATLLRDGLTRNPRDSAQAMLLARVLIAQGDAAGALEALERHGVPGAEADGLRGGILTQQGDTARALGAYESAARQQPANPMWWLGLGVALDSEGQPQRARQAYARALALGLPRDDLTQYADRRIRGND